MVITATVTESEAARICIAPRKPYISLPHADTTTGRIVLIVHGNSSKVDFGAEVYGIDLNRFTDADFDFISDSLHKHKLLVFKEQPEMLKPQQQYRLASQ